MKSDPGTFSWGDLEARPARTTCWDGIRNYQARNYLRDEVRAGDGVLFYHSQTDKAVMGTAKVAKAGHPDPTQFDPKHAGYDAAARRENPTWFAVDLKWESAFTTPVTLDAMRRAPGLEQMGLLRKGSRLSVQPVTAKEWKIVVGLGTAK
jgi:predicted RNA-binding protein with PUA-like domain